MRDVLLDSKRIIFVLLHLVTGWEYQKSFVYLCMGTGSGGFFLLRKSYKV